MELEEKRNIYNAINNLYNMDSVTWQQVLAVMYNTVSDIEGKFDIIESKFGILLPKEVREEIKRLTQNGELADIINEEVFEGLNKKIIDIDKKVNDTKEELSSQLADIVHLMPEPNGIDDTQVIRDFFAKGYKNVKFRKGTYNISLDGTNHRECLMWFTDLTDINLSGEETIINDKTIYQKDKLVNIFGFTRCKNISIKGIQYIGVQINDPDSNLNTTGGTFAYFEDNCTNIEVDLHGTNLRYGVRSGDYLNPYYGNCQDFKLNVDGNMIGYPVCVYLGTNVNCNVKVDGFHRAVYLAGVDRFNINSNSKNIYGEITHVLLTNTIEVWNDNKDLRKVKACSNGKVYAKDNNSTKMHNNTMLIQIALAWVNECEFENINCEFIVNSNNDYSHKVGGFAIQSAVKNQRPEYPFNFEPYIKFNNIRVKGNINRIGQTIQTNALGEIFIRTYDSDDVNFEHLPAIKNIIFDNIIYSKGSIQTRNFYIDTPGCEKVLFKNCEFNGINVSASGKNIIFDNSMIGNLTSYKTIDELNNINSYIQGIDSTKVISIINTSNIIYPFIRKTRTRVVPVTLNGSSSITVNGLLKRGASIKAILGQISGYKTDGTWEMGVQSNPSLFGSSSINASSGYNRFSMLNYAVDVFPKYFNKDTDLVITFKPTDGITYPIGDLNLFIEDEIFEVS